MTRLCERANRLSALLRSCLLALVASEGLYLVMMVLFNGVLIADVFMTRHEFIFPLRDYGMYPWSGALLALYLAREKRSGGLDIWTLVVLELWIAVPFIMRFKTEYFTTYSAYGFAISFFVFYASIRESDAQRRARQLDVACAGFCLLSIVLGGALLYCATTGKNYCSYWDTRYFGVVYGQLQHGLHYNSTGMLAVVCTMICMVGLCRSRRKPYAVFYLLGVIIMALVVVLTQSRTARYAMLGAFAVGTWNGLAEYLPIRKTLLRHGAALACAAVVLVGGYAWCLQITDAALAHYAGRPSVVEEALLPSALAEETEAEKPEPLLARSQKVDATFSERTLIWKNVLRNWKENPWHMLIGNGSGRTKWLVAENTYHEATGFAYVHNAYLYFAAEFGWIGFAMLALFMISILPSVLRVFFAHGEKRMPGGCALCMLVIAILATGMMENEPLDAMATMNLTLFFALGQLAGTGRELKKNK